MTFSDLFNFGSVKNKQNSVSECESLQQGNQFLKLQGQYRPPNKRAALIEGFDDTEESQENIEQPLPQTIDDSIKDDLEKTKKDINEAKEQYVSSKEQYEAMVKEQIGYIDGMKENSVKLVTFPVCNAQSVDPETRKYGAYPVMKSFDDFNKTSYADNTRGTQKRCKALSNTYGVSMFGEVEEGVVDYNMCFNTVGKTNDEIKNYIENEYSDTWVDKTNTITDERKNKILTDAARQLKESEAQLLAQVQGVWTAQDRSSGESCSELLNTTLYTNKGKPIVNKLEQSAASVTAGIVGAADELGVGTAMTTAAENTAKAAGAGMLQGMTGGMFGTLDTEGFENPPDEEEPSESNPGAYTNGNEPVIEPGSTVTDTGAGADADGDGEAVGADAVGDGDVVADVEPEAGVVPDAGADMGAGAGADMGAGADAGMGAGAGELTGEGELEKVPEPKAIVGKCNYSKKYMLEDLVTKKGITYCQQYAYINRFGFLQPFMVSKDKSKFNEEHARKLGLYIKNGAGGAFNDIKKDIFKDGSRDIDYTSIESSGDIEASIGKKIVLGAPILLSEEPSESVPFDLAGTMVVVDGNEELRAWIDYKGYKHEFTPEDVLPKSCPKEYRKVTEDQFNNLTQGEDIVDGEVCNFLDTMGGSAMIAAKSQMEMDRESYFNKLEDLNNRIKSVWGQANLTSTEANSMESSIQSEMNQLGVDNDTLNNLVEVRDTIRGQEEISKMTLGSNKMQLVIWSVIGIAVLLYTIFGIGTDDSFKGKHLVMLIICAIIFFVLARTMYNTRKTLNDF